MANHGDYSRGRATTIVWRSQELFSPMGTFAGVDIGGTKCAVSLGQDHGAEIAVVARHVFPTPPTPEATLAEIIGAIERLSHEGGAVALDAIGVSCGGPLDSRAGLVLSPPNLPGWDRIDVVAPLRDRFDVPVGLQNDADAGALAEWTWGAGRGRRNMIFLTFGTGMGAGLILNGALYTGANGMVGEVGHMRLEDDGPLGYGKAGSFEGFCSGGGIARLARAMAVKRLEGGSTLYCPTPADLPSVTAQRVGEAARRGDRLALDVFDIVGRQLGRGLAMLVDILNPELIVIGGIYGRQRAILEPIALAELRKEALPRSLSACEIVPAGLGERVGDVASLCVALHTSASERS